jgi:Arc/MetJ-type ribon-helix-helix transcriptional regulator
VLPQWLDQQVSERGYASRSAVIQVAIDALRHGGLEEDYAEAFREWEESGDAAPWEAVVGDGLD